MSDQVPVKNVHHVELIVGNARQAAYYYRKAFGFSQVAYLGPETGHRDRASYALEQGDVRLVVTTPLHPDHAGSEHIRKHGDGVSDIALRVEDVDRAFALTVERGAEPAVPPRTIEDEHGSVRHAAVHTYGDTLHSFYSLDGYDGPFLPGYRPERREEEGVGLWRIDHIVGNVEDRQMDVWADWYTRVFDFHQFLSFDDKDISTEYTALRSKVMASPNRVVKFPINEPAEGLKKSQIQEYIDFYHGPGVQHVALFSDDIISTVSNMRDRGVDFLTIPDTYYDDLWERVGEVKEDHDAIQDLNILVDRDDEGYLLQIFTQPVQDRPTLFYEIIQRRGAQGFGKGNFKALFVSIERAQEARGNL
jgi:4-hydroxyphenylpyruvate dioxygenase